MERIKPQTHDDYLQHYTGPIRETLDEIRALIRDLVPEAEEYIGYGIPAFLLTGKYFTGYGGAKRLCALYPGSGILDKYRDELAADDTRKGTLRLKPGEPLPVELLSNMILDLKRDRLGNVKS